MKNSGWPPTQSLQTGISMAPGGMVPSAPTPVSSAPRSCLTDRRSTPPLRRPNRVAGGSLRHPRTDAAMLNGFAFAAWLAAAEAPGTSAPGSGSSPTSLGLAPNSGPAAGVDAARDTWRSGAPRPGGRGQV